MNSPLLMPAYEKPEVSQASEKVARCLANFYHIRHRKEYITYLIRNDLSHGAKYVLNGQTIILHLINVAGEWYHFSYPTLKSYFRVFIDRANAVCLRERLPTLHRIQNVWFWSDGVPWGGERTLPVPKKQVPVSNRLRAIFKDPWI